MQPRIFLHLGFITSIAAILLAWNQVGAPKVVHLEVDGASFLRETRQVQVGGLLREAGVSLGPGDVVEPPVDAALSHEETVRVSRAIPVTLRHHNTTVELRTAAATVDDVLRTASVSVGLYDAVLLDGKSASLETSLRRRSGDTSPQDARTSDPLAPAGRPPALGASLEIHRAIPLYVHDQGFLIEVYSLRATLQGSLNAAGIGLKPGDVSVPLLAGPARPGQHVYLRRAKEITLRVDGTEQALRTPAKTVKEVLEQANVQLGPGDRIEPLLETAIKSGVGITVIRVNEERATLDEAITSTTAYVADDTLEVGEQTLVQGGMPGLRKRQVHLLYEDGREVRRIVEREWIEAPPQQAIVHYGTKIVLRTIETPSGPLQYWRTLRVYATWYTPFSAGKAPGSPGYGITSLGMEARRGIIAVDPRVIPYYTQLYVPGYGVGIAADTGGGIRGYMVDLAFGDDEEPEWTTRWVEVYLLGPGPEPSEIRPPSP